MSEEMDSALRAADHEGERQLQTKYERLVARMDTQRRWAVPLFVVLLLAFLGYLVLYSYTAPYDPLRGR
jgi:hypothetical protein